MCLRGRALRHGACTGLRTYRRRPSQGRKVTAPRPPMFPQSSVSTMPRRQRARTTAEQLELTASAEVIGPFAAPFARDVGAVIDDLALVDLARAVVEVCCRPDATSGLSLREIASRVSAEDEVLERRLRVFTGLGMLRPLDDRKGAMRYVLDPRALAGVQIVERITTQGGVSELLLLLDRTSAAIETRTATGDQVAAALAQARVFFQLFADTFARLTRAPIAELYAEVRRHEQQRLLTNLDHLVRLVAAAYPELEPLGHQTVVEAQRYDRYLGAAADRIVAEGGAARAFDVLTPETWRTAAIHAPWEELADVAATLVFDTGGTVVHAQDIVAALEDWRPRGIGRELPAEPDIPPGPDPLALRRQLRAARRDRLDREVGALLEDGTTVDVTATLRTRPWRAAAAILSDILEADRHPEISVAVEIGNGLLAEAGLEVTWCSTPVRLSRISVRDATVADRHDADEESS